MEINLAISALYLAPYFSFYPWEFTVQSYVLAYPIAEERDRANEPWQSQSIFLSVENPFSELSYADKEA